MAKKPTKLPRGAAKGRKGKTLQKLAEKKPSPASAVDVEKESVALETAQANEAPAVAPADKPTEMSAVAPKQRKKPGPKPGAKKAAAKKPAPVEAATESPVKPTPKKAAAKSAKKETTTKTENKEAPIGKAAVKDSVQEAVYVQYLGGETEVADVVARAKADYLESHKKAKISSLKVFIKPDEKMAYYVINESGFGKFSIK
jgi:outer membrane biosynthesis protein TonB